MWLLALSLLLLSSWLKPTPHFQVKIRNIQFICNFSVHEICDMWMNHHSWCDVMWLCVHAEGSSDEEGVSPHPPLPPKSLALFDFEAYFRVSSKNPKLHREPAFTVFFLLFVISMYIYFVLRLAFQRRFCSPVFKNKNHF